MPQFILMTVTYIVTLTLTFSSYFMKINGQSALEISNRFPVMFAPKDISYLIWIFIFALLGYWLVSQYKERHRDVKVFTKQALLFSTSCILQMMMIITWHQEQFIISLVLTFILLLTLFALYNTYPLSNNKLTGRVPLSIYFAWMTFLFMTNISFTLTTYEWNGFGLSNLLWSLVFLSIGTAIAMHIRFHHFDITYPIVFIWGYLGIALHNGFDELLITIAALFLCGVLIVGILFVKKNPAHQN